MTLNRRKLLYLVLPLGFIVTYFLASSKLEITNTKQIDIGKLDKAIEKATEYYNSLYIDLGDKAVFAEYHPEIKYTIRHATIGAYYYYKATSNATKSAKLKKTIDSLGFNVKNDQHSFIWKETTDVNQSVVYSPKEYHDCDVTLPILNNIKPYHSKVCRLGYLGTQAYIFVSHFDNFLPMITTLVQIEHGKTVDISSFKKQFEKLGYGVPMCSFLGCSQTASTIRTAHLGELALRTKDYTLADQIASSLINAQDTDGAIYIAFNKAGKLDTRKGIAYKLIDYLFNDKEAYNGTIKTNAETMNNSLAFLMHYRASRFSKLVSVDKEKR